MAAGIMPLTVIADCVESRLEQKDDVAGQPRFWRGAEAGSETFQANQSRRVLAQGAYLIVTNTSNVPVMPDIIMIIHFESFSLTTSTIQLLHTDLVHFTLPM